MRPSSHASPRVSGACALSGPTASSTGQLKDHSTRGKFLQGLLTRTSRHADKPTDFADLQKLHKAWRKDGAQRGDPRAFQLHDLATRYLGWAEQQRPDRKLQDHRSRAAVMVDETMTSPASTPPSPPSASPKPSSPQRLRKAMDAAWAGFRQQIKAPKPGTFAALRGAYERMSNDLKTRPFDEAQALEVRRLAVDYGNRQGDKAPKDEVQHQKRRLAANYVAAIDARIAKDRFQRQLDLDTACDQVNSPDLRVRTADRQKHAAGLIRNLPSLNGAHDGTSDRRIVRADGAPQYRFVPMPTRQAADHQDIGPQHAVLASILHRDLLENIGVNLRFPCATTAMLEGMPGVLMDHLDLPSPEDVGKASALDLQAAVVAQWVLGRPKAGWGDVEVDRSGHLRPRDLPLAALSPRDIADRALSKWDGDRSSLSGMFFDPASGDPIPGLHVAVDSELSKRLLELDLDALTTRMRLAQDAIDLKTAVHGVKAGQAQRHYVASHPDAVGRLLEPLRALQAALTAGPDLPLAMVLVDAAEALSHSGHA